MRIFIIILVLVTSMIPINSTMKKDTVYADITPIKLNNTDANINKKMSITSSGPANCYNYTAYYNCPSGGGIYAFTKMRPISVMIGLKSKDMSMADVEWFYCDDPNKPTIALFADDQILFKLETRMPVKCLDDRFNYCGNNEFSNYLNNYYISSNDETTNFYSQMIKEEDIWKLYTNWFATIPSQTKPIKNTGRLSYYLEFWNMTERDNEAPPEGDPNLCQFSEDKKGLVCRISLSSTIGNLSDLISYSEVGKLIKSEGKLVPGNYTLRASYCYSYTTRSYPSLQVGTAYFCSPWTYCCGPIMQQAAMSTQSPKSSSIYDYDCTFPIETGTWPARIRVSRPRSYGTSPEYTPPTGGADGIAQYNCINYKSRLYQPYFSDTNNDGYIDFKDSNNHILPPSSSSEIRYYKSSISSTPSTITDGEVYISSDYFKKIFMRPGVNSIHNMPQYEMDLFSSYANPELFFVSTDKYVKKGRSVTLRRNGLEINIRGCNNILEVTLPKYDIFSCVSDSISNTLNSFNDSGKQQHGVYPRYRMPNGSIKVQQKIYIQLKHPIVYNTTYDDYFIPLKDLCYALGAILVYYPWDKDKSGNQATVNFFDNAEWVQNGREVAAVYDTRFRIKDNENTSANPFPSNQTVALEPQPIPPSNTYIPIISRKSSADYPNWGLSVALEKVSGIPEDVSYSVVASPFIRDTGNGVQKTTLHNSFYFSPLFKLSQIIDDWSADSGNMVVDRILLPVGPFGGFPQIYSSMVDRITFDKFNTENSTYPSIYQLESLFNFDAYRDPEINSKLGGDTYSWHMFARGIDGPYGYKNYLPAASLLADCPISCLEDGDSETTVYNPQDGRKNGFKWNISDPVLSIKYDTNEYVSNLAGTNPAYENLDQTNKQFFHPMFKPYWEIPKIDSYGNKGILPLIPDYNDQTLVKDGRRLYYQYPGSLVSLETMPQPSGWWAHVNIAPGPRHKWGDGIYDGTIFTGDTAP